MEAAETTGEALQYFFKATSSQYSMVHPHGKNYSRTGLIRSRSTQTHDSHPPQPSAPVLPIITGPRPPGDVQISAPIRLSMQMRRRGLLAFSAAEDCASRILHPSSCRFLRILPVLRRRSAHVAMMFLGVLAVTLGLVASSPIPNNTKPAVSATSPAVPATTPTVPATSPAVHSTTSAVHSTTPAIPGSVIAKLPGQSSVNEMLEEVEELFGDTQTKLENAVKELQAEESAKELASLKDLQDLPPNYHNKTVKETKVGNATIVTKEEIIKETDNKTGSTYVSKTVISSLKNGNKTQHPPHHGHVMGASQTEWLSPMDMLNRLMCFLSFGEHGCSDMEPQILVQLEDPETI